MADEETHYQVLRLLDSNPGLSQRDVAAALGVSLGKVNYCVKELVKKGWLKAANFKNSRNKMAYMYILTPRGLDQKGRLTVRFLRRKMREYESLRAEIELLRQEAHASRR